MMAEFRHVPTFLNSHVKPTSSKRKRDRPKLASTFSGRTRSDAAIDSPATLKGLNGLPYANSRKTLPTERTLRQSRRRRTDPPYPSGTPYYDTDIRVTRSQRAPNGRYRQFQPNDDTQLNHPDAMDYGYDNDIGMSTAISPLSIPASGQYFPLGSGAAGSQIPHAILRNGRRIQADPPIAWNLNGQMSLLDAGFGVARCKILSKGGYLLIKHLTSEGLVCDIQDMHFFRDRFTLNLFKDQDQTKASVIEVVRKITLEVMARASIIFETNGEMDGADDDSESEREEDNDNDNENDHDREPGENYSLVGPAGVQEQMQVIEKQRGRQRSTPQKEKNVAVLPKSGHDSPVLQTNSDHDSDQSVEFLLTRPSLYTSTNSRL